MIRTLDDRAVLAQRARELAQPVSAPGALASSELALIFSRGAARYAIDTRFVIQIVPLGECAPLPAAPPHCLGLSAARGELLALFDLPPLTGDASAGEAAPKSILLCGQSKLEFGLAVDEAIDLVELGASLEPACDETELVSGVDARGFVVIDGAALLRDPRFRLDPANHEISNDSSN